MGRTIFTNANLVDGERPPRGGAVVVVEGERIAAAGDGPPPPALPDDRVIDLGGKTVMPGMITCHLHAAYQNVGAGTAPPGMEAPPALQAIRAAEERGDGADERLHRGCGGQRVLRHRRLAQAGYRRRPHPRAAAHAVEPRPGHDRRLERLRAVVVGGARARRGAYLQRPRRVPLCGARRDQARRGDHQALPHWGPRGKAAQGHDDRHSRRDGRRRRRGPRAGEAGARAYRLQARHSRSRRLRRRRHRPRRHDGRGMHRGVPRSGIVRAAEPLSPAADHGGGRGAGRERLRLVGRAEAGLRVHLAASSPKPPPRASRSASATTSGRR